MTFLLPKIEYYNFIFICTNKTFLTKIENLNKKLLKFTVLDQTHFSINHRAFVNAATFLYKIHTNKLPDFTKYFKKTLRNSNSRLLYTIFFVKKSILKYSLLNWGPMLSNHLYMSESGALCATSLFTVKSHLKHNVSLFTDYI